MTITRHPFDVRRSAASLGIILFVAACSGTGAGTSPSASTAASPPAATTTPSDDGYSRGGSASPSASIDASPSTSPASGGMTYEVKVASGAVGSYLTGEGGKTLYTFKPDSANTSTCNGDCATTWPPFAVAADATLTAGSGVGGKLTTFARADGSMQVAYNGTPLYYFAADAAAGDTNGQGIGGKWFVAAP